MKVVAFLIPFALTDLIGWNRLGNNVHFRKMHRPRWFKLYYLYIFLT